MADEEQFDLEVADEDSEGSSYKTLGIVLLLIVVLAVTLILWNQCASSNDESDGNSGGNGAAVIVEVEDLEVQEGGIAVWLREEGDIEVILARNGLGEAEYLDMGAGTFVITTADMDIDALVEDLKTDPDLYDAGFVFLEE